MKPFMDKDFLLTTPTASALFHQFAENMPIIDYHCHVSPKEIYEDVRFENITQAWLKGDHYKWRLMRSNGVDESISPVMQPTAKNSKSLQRLCPVLSVTPCIIGVILNFKDILVTTAPLTVKPLKKYGTLPAKS